MDQILRLNKSEQAQLFQQAAARSSTIKETNIFEKDFWVCWTLQQIFNDSEVMPYITFKGGTSLSKCYNLIDRFSEDCDLTIDKEWLGLANDDEAMSQKSRKQRDKYLKQLTQTTKQKIKDYIKPLLESLFQTAMDDYFSKTEWKIETDPNDEQTLLFHYPSSIKQTSHYNEYIRSCVKLEFGARGDRHPSELREITPYIYDGLLDEVLSTKPKILVNTLTSERTFWEKITLLHAEHHRNSDKPPKARYFRHYYDVVKLHQQRVTDRALENLQLLILY